MSSKRASWAAALFALLLATGSAADTKIYVGAWSQHLVQSGDLNERHDLLALERKNWFAGRFINSHGRETFTVSYHWTWRHGHAELGVFTGAMHGYTRCIGEDGTGKDVCPLIAPTAAYTKYQLHPVLILMGDALAIGARFEL